tara:strand:- start:176 stop:553 length:378 start_codon:yes stop_codon:yes gene_type:complete
MKLSKYLNAINHTKENVLDTDDESVEKEYVPYIINRCLSYFPDTIFYINQMNQMSYIDKKLHFDYLLNSVRKRKRFSKWLKTEKIKEIELIKRHYNYSYQKAKEVLPLLTKENIKEMEFLYKDIS